VTVVGAILAGGFAVKVCMCKYIEVFLTRALQPECMHVSTLSHICLFFSWHKRTGGCSLYLGLSLINHPPLTGPFLEN
jgi:hypothetical protein